MPFVAESTGEENANLYKRGVSEGSRGELLDASELLELLDVFGEDGVRSYLVGFLEGVDDAMEEEDEQLLCDARVAQVALRSVLLTAGCSEIDPSPYRCVRCLLEDLCTTMVDTIERSTPKSKADRSNIIETRYRCTSGRSRKSGRSSVPKPGPSGGETCPSVTSGNSVTSSLYQTV